MSIATVVFFSLVCAANPAVRLVNGTSSCSGRVEVFTKSEWKRVCDINWDMKDAMAVCRQLGCGNAIAVPYRLGQEHGGKSIITVKCSGNEYTLDECLLNGYTTVMMLLLSVQVRHCRYCIKLLFLFNSK
jgi:hypothetical protein